MFQLLHDWVHAFEPFLVPICFVLAWLLVILTGWSIWGAIASTVARAKYMHQIPCANCEFFTNDYRLKCPVHPHMAQTEGAIGCSDYREVKSYMSYE